MTILLGLFIDFASESRQKQAYENSCKACHKSGSIQEKWCPWKTITLNFHHSCWWWLTCNIYRGILRINYVQEACNFYLWSACFNEWTYTCAPYMCSLTNTVLIKMNFYIWREGFDTSLLPQFNIRESSQHQHKIDFVCLFVLACSSPINNFFLAFRSRI